LAERACEHEHQPLATTAVGGRRQRNGGNANGRELVARAPDRFDITVIGGEPHPSYNRILLSSVLAGERTLAEIVIQPSSWYEKHGIHLIAGNHATAIDPVTRRVALADGATVPYDKLLLATGSKPLAPPIPGLDFCQCARLPRSPMSRQ
jgi:NAD(P)H-nitrite reductase large subunit